MSIRFVSALLAAVVCAGCATLPPEAPASIPDDAIKVGDDLYMVPLPDAVGGCEVFRQASRRRMVTAALYYRSREGGFTLDRSEAACE